ncbi:MAG TPA: protein-glutamate O-methyltransferase CheR [Gammaproteobacteria bacterium]|nr:protein-glutamate O-methyltransferase CheR [Gammaproteobacteria bacterium]
MSSCAGESFMQAARNSAGPELHMDERQLAYWTRYIEDEAGVFIAPERKSFLLSGLRACMRELGCRELSEYHRLLSRGPSKARAWSGLIDRLTVHETCFFRHASSLKLVEKETIPRALSRHGSFRAWSVACASGEEAWSLAMLADDVTRRATGLEARPFSYSVTGTDISLESLRAARRAHYPARSLRHVPEAYRARYCRAAKAGHFTIVEDLRRRVCFTRANLLQLDQVPLKEMDLVYCQNLLIYYDRHRRKEIVRRLVDFLRPGGMLILGPGELLRWQHPAMEKVRYPDTLAYRRAD